MSGSPFLVELEFERVQTYLFDVPELRAMAGANARLGETLRGRLTDEGFVDGENLPALARKEPHQASLPDATIADVFPSSADDGDPLQVTGKDVDDPRRAAELGILARDGGHFHAVFSDEKGAKAFVAAARALAARRLSGLLLDARVVPLTKGANGWTRPERAPDVPEDAGGEDLLDLPQFQVCQVVGRGPAGEKGDRPEERTPGAERWIGASVAERREAGKDFDDGHTTDVLGLLREPMLTKLGLPPNRDDVLPTDFEKLARVSRQVAVVVADGNGIGHRSDSWRKGGKSQDFFVREACGEEFFRSMRVAVRAAFLEAIAATFQELKQISRKKPLPFRPLMLGGDDLLFVCDAAFAPYFVVEYAKALQTRNLADEKPLEIGVGVAIVNRTFPFHRAHALAEQLAASAKRRYREDGSGSFVDWLAVSESWHEEVQEVRARDAVRRYKVERAEETLVLSAKPYPILGGAGSLGTLLAEATKAVVGKLPRSQIIGFAQALEHGRRQAEFALRNLPDRVRQPMAAAVEDDSPWSEPTKGRFVTRVLDFLELFELERLRQHAMKQSEAAHA
jgi:hypothetical protein